jgi:hypothetical protein
MSNSPREHLIAIAQVASAVLVFLGLVGWYMATTVAAHLGAVAAFGVGFAVLKLTSSLAPKQSEPVQVSNVPPKDAPPNREHAN